MKVLKFGGTSVGSLEMIKKTAEIVVNSKKDNDIIVVVSAMSGVTDTLIKVCDFVTKGDKEKISIILNELKQKHIEVAHFICNGSCDIKFINQINSYINDLEDIIKGVTILRQLSGRGRAKILYFGEILSSLIVSLAISQLGISSNNYLSRDLLICSGDYLDGECDFKKSEIKNKDFLNIINIQNEIPVITGFGGGDEEKNVYLFDRGGSDYVATLLGRFLEVEVVEIWTDVSGVMSADPRIVDNPIIWKELDYSVSAEFALAGAKILHPKTISPVQKKSIPIYIKNTFSPESYGTKICNIDDKGTRGISIDDKQMIFTFIDPSMIGKSGYISDVIKKFSDLHISIDALATTETSFSLSIKKKNYCEEILQELDHLKERFDLEITEEVSKISIVGDFINDYSLILDFEDIIMISKGAHPKSITIFVKKGDSKNLIKKLHERLFRKN